MPKPPYASPARLAVHTGTLAALLCVVNAGCGQREYAGPQRFPLTGKVTVDGQPLDWGSISFLPLAKEGGEQRVSGGLITDGVYQVPEDEGANAGTHRVEIRWNKRTGKKLLDPDSREYYDERKEALPPKYHKNSELTAEVSETQTSFDFDLKTK